MGFTLRTTAVILVAVWVAAGAVAVAQESAGSGAEACLWVETMPSRMLAGTGFEDAAHCLEAAVDGDFVVLGRALRHTKSANIGPACPGLSFCLSHWYSWRIAVDTHIGGPEAGRLITAVSAESSGIRDSVVAEMRVFVLRPITDDVQAKLLRAEYLLLESSADCLDSGRATLLQAAASEPGIAIRQQGEVRCVGRQADSD